ncbi:SGNH/GDSL hydrolase family protein [Paracoccus onubensis]|uniref:SGNH/GDSL hydrolase family protein n=1 Tax=Paracoccus onubensis TaxID=1675788 RepID=UPI00272FC79A|nr:SGNH/GDSL hydrolase family protein [Paracoccus onubensis]MDP0929687.1 SGNH/GDSL hydrolase family protein [Paracoccus onubensis]
MTAPSLSGQRATVLTYGDSLTWGVNPGARCRHLACDRWPVVLGCGLGDQVEIIAEGLPGRTTAYDDPGAVVDRNGARVLPPILASHVPLDVVIFMLGTNDLKPQICGTASGATQGMRQLLRIVLRQRNIYDMPAPKILVVSPPVARITDATGANPFWLERCRQAQELAPLFRAVADAEGAAFFDAACVARTSDVDGVHLDADASRAIGAALVPVVARLLQQDPATGSSAFGTDPCRSQISPCHPDAEGNK